MPRNTLTAEDKARVDEICTKYDPERNSMFAEVVSDLKLPKEYVEPLLRYFRRIMRAEVTMALLTRALLEDVEVTLYEEGWDDLLLTRGAEDVPEQFIMQLRENAGTSYEEKHLGELEDIYLDHLALPSNDLVNNITYGAVRDAVEEALGAVSA